VINVDKKERDAAILHKRSTGLTHKQIADMLGGISTDTVKAVLKKYGAPTTFTKTCQHCQEPYTTGNARSLYCSTTCKRQKLKETTGLKLTCKECGETFRSATKSAYCIECLYRVKQRKERLKIEREEEQKRREEERQKQLQKVCVHCSISFIAKKTDARYCSSECVYQSRYSKQVEAKEVHSIKCKECSKFFATTNTSRKYCSHKCMTKYRDRRKEVTRRERVLSNGDVHKDISIERLIKRDKGICYLCNEKVNINVDSNDNFYPSIEHVIPIAKGGTHTWDNVKLAHRYCNMIKRDYLLDETASTQK
jgi:hypothetical protein